MKQKTFTAEEIREELLVMLPLVVIAQHGTEEEGDEAFYLLWDEFRSLLGKTEDSSLSNVGWDDYVEVILAEKEEYIGRLDKTLHEV